MSDLMINFSAFLIGIIVSIVSLSTIVDVVFKQFSKSFEKQIEYYKTYTDKALQAHLEGIDASQTYSFEIRENFDFLEKKLKNVSFIISKLNDLCESRVELENEIIKLKNIIKRQNKIKDK